MPIRTLVKVPISEPEPLRFPLFAESRVSELGLKHAKGGPQ